LLIAGIIGQSWRSYQKNGVVFCDKNREGKSNHTLNSYPAYDDYSPDVYDIDDYLLKDFIKEESIPEFISDEEELHYKFMEYLHNWEAELAREEYH